ncbi:MAG: hypothetical protein ACRDY2_03220 [Acidimicrobiales bacterium]
MNGFFLDGGGRARRASASLAVASAVMASVLAGCGSSTNHRTPPTAHLDPPSVCASAGSLDHLVVTRRDVFPQNHIRFSFPSSVTIDAPAQVRNVARALCALPAMPSGSYHCPEDLGISYNLRFAGPGLLFPAIGVDATGCEGVSGFGFPSRWVATSPHFWVTLGEAMGLANPSYGVFRGDEPGTTG